MERRSTPAPPSRKGSIRVRMSRNTHDRWGVWCQIHGMTLEESINLLLARHPIDMKQFEAWWEDADGMVAAPRPTGCRSEVKAKETAEPVTLR